MQVGDSLMSFPAICLQRQVILCHSCVRNADFINYNFLQLNKSAFLRACLKTRLLGIIAKAVIGYGAP